MLPTTRTDPSTWLSGIDLPTRMFGVDDDFELYEQDGEFVLGVELPGFDPEEIDLRWHEGRLRVAAEHEDEAFDRRKTFHRTFRLPKEIDDEGIEAQYENGVLYVYLPVVEDAVVQGDPIEIQS